MGFIKKIEIENFYSIKNAISLDLESSEYMIKNHSDRVIKSKNENYSILNAIYGANASGKSSILRAIIAVSQVISNSSDERLPISFKNKFKDYENKQTKKYDLKLNYFEDSPSMFQAVENGNADFLMEDYPVIAYKIKVDSNAKLKIVGEKLDTVNYGFAVKKGANADLLKKFNDGLKKFAQAIEIKDYSSETFVGMLNSLMYLDVNYTITQSFTPMGRVKAKDKLKKQQNQLKAKTWKMDCHYFCIKLCYLVNPLEKIK